MQANEEALKLEQQGVAGRCSPNNVRSQGNPAIEMLGCRSYSHRQVHARGQFHQSGTPQVINQVCLSAAGYTFAVTIKHNRGFGRSVPPTRRVCFYCAGPSMGSLLEGLLS